MNRLDEILKCMLIEACEDCGAYYYPYDNDGWRNERPVAIKRFGGEL